MARKSQRFAQGTSVPVERTRMEIEKTVKRYGAEAFATFDDPSCQMIAFRVSNLNVRFTVPLPMRKDMSRDSRHGYMLSESKTTQRVEAETRRRWRALLLSIKAKLEMVESGLACFEEEFLAHVVTGSGQTIGEALAPQIESIQKGATPPLLPGPTQAPAPEAIEPERMGKPTE